MNNSTKNNLIFSITRIIKLCHPIIPFITEDIWREFLNKGFVSEKMLINSSFPSQIRISKEYDIDQRVTSIKNIIRRIRKTRTELGISPKEMIPVQIIIKDNNLKNDISEHLGLISSMSNVDINIVEQQDNKNEYIDLIDDDYTIYLKIRNMVNVNEEMIRIDKKVSELMKIIDKIEAKLNNKDFIERAPSSIINQNVANKTKIENDILSLKGLRDTLSD